MHLFVFFWTGPPGLWPRACQITDTTTHQPTNPSTHRFNPLVDSTHQLIDSTHQPIEYCILEYLFDNDSTHQPINSSIQPVNSSTHRFNSSTQLRTTNVGTLRRLLIETCLRFRGVRCCFVLVNSSTRLLINPWPFGTFQPGPADCALRD